MLVTKYWPNILFVLILSFLCTYCSYFDQSKNALEHSLTSGPDSTFGSRVALGKITASDMDEISGITVSRYNTNLIWGHNDSGNKPRLFLFNRDGRLLTTFYIPKITNRDWEDMTAGPGPDSSKTYLIYRRYRQQLCMAANI